MKVKVIKKFKDIETKKIRNVGEEFECSEERFNAILEVAPLIVEIEDNELISSLSVKDLKKMATDMGLEAKGTKKELIELISENMAENEQNNSENDTNSTENAENNAENEQNNEEK